jgi:hypothetical protein
MGHFYGKRQPPTLLFEKIALRYINVIISVVTRIPVPITVLCVVYYNWFSDGYDMFFLINTIFFHPIFFTFSCVFAPPKDVLSFVVVMLMCYCYFQFVVIVVLWATDFSGRPQATSYKLQANAPHHEPPQGITSHPNITSYHRHHKPHHRFTSQASKIRVI